MSGSKPYPAPPQRYRHRRRPSQRLRQGSRRRGGRIPGDRHADAVPYSQRDTDEARASPTKTDNHAGKANTHAAQGAGTERDRHGRGGSLRRDDPS
jgi:hypothetical protein